MSTSFLLKDASGRIWGYLVQCDKTIKCRINRKLDELAEVLCMYEDGTWESFCAPSDEKEHLWEKQCSRITAAAVIQNEELLLETGNNAAEAARRIIRQKQEKRLREEKARAKPQRQNKRDSVGRIEESKKQTDGRQINRWPQRRWPPPPCLPEGRYENGIWKNQE